MCRIVICVRLEYNLTACVPSCPSVLVSCLLFSALNIVSNIRLWIWFVIHWYSICHHSIICFDFPFSIASSLDPILWVSYPCILQFYVQISRVVLGHVEVSVNCVEFICSHVYVYSTNVYIVLICDNMNQNYQFCTTHLHAKRYVIKFTRIFYSEKSQIAKCVKAKTHNTDDAMNTESI